MITISKLSENIDYKIESLQISVRSSLA